MAFEGFQTDKSREIQSEVDEFFKTIHRNAAALTMALGSMMVPGMVPRMAGWGVPKMSDKMLMSGQGERVFSKSQGKFLDPPAVKAAPKAYTGVSGRTSEQFRSPATKTGTQGRGLGQGLERRAIASEEAGAAGKKMISDPVEWLTKRAQAHYTKLTATEKETAGFTHWSDVLELWTQKKPELFKNEEFRGMLMKSGLLGE